MTLLPWLRTGFDGHLNVDLLVRGLQVYKNMQHATAPHVDAFLQAGASIDSQKLHETCFNGWLEDKENMIRVVEIINILLPVYLLFAQKRFLDAINLPYNADNPMSVKQHAKINKGFIWFIDNMAAEL